MLAVPQARKMAVLCTIMVVPSKTKEGCGQISTLGCDSTRLSRQSFVQQKDSFLASVIQPFSIDSLLSSSSPRLVPNESQQLMQKLHQGNSLATVHHNGQIMDELSCSKCRLGLNQSCEECMRNMDLSSPLGPVFHSICFQDKHAVCH